MYAYRMLFDDASFTSICRDSVDRTYSYRQKNDVRHEATRNINDRYLNKLSTIGWRKNGRRSKVWLDRKRDYGQEN